MAFFSVLASFPELFQLNGSFKFSGSGINSAQKDFSILFALAEALA